MYAASRFNAARAADINAMYADDAVRAVFAVRGGWGCARLLPYLVGIPWAAALAITSRMWMKP